MTGLEGKKTDVWSVLQTLILVATAAGIFLTVGRRDREISFNTAQLGELRQITTELVRSQVLSEVTDATHVQAIADLKRRVDRLEGR